MPEPVARDARENRLHQQLLDDFRVMLHTSEGLHLVGRILGECQVDKSQFTTDAHEMFFRSGMRHVGIFIKGLIKEACPDKWMSIVKEYEKISNFYHTGGEADLDAALTESKIKGKARFLEIKP